MVAANLSDIVDACEAFLGSVKAQTTIIRTDVAMNSTATA